MATHNAHPASTDRQDAPTASLTVELRSDERTRLGVFRETFLKWVSDRSAGTLALGAPDSLTLEEVQPGPDGTPMVAINIRCLEGVDPDALKPTRFDGRSR